MRNNSRLWQTHDREAAEVHAAFPPKRFGSGLTNLWRDDKWAFRKMTRPSRGEAKLCGAANPGGSRLLGGFLHQVTGEFPSEPRITFESYIRRYVTFPYN